MTNLIWTIIFVFGICGHAFADIRTGLHVDNSIISHIFSWVHLKDHNLTLFRATWTVPTLPSSCSGQKLAIWSGFETEDSRVILQPVLQFGNWANGGDNRWEIACWAVTVTANRKSSNAVYSRRTWVRPGTEITAVVSLISHANGIYTYKCYFEGYPTSAMLYSLKEPMISAFLDYETHYLHRCSDHAGAVTFNNVEVRSGELPMLLRWRKHVEDPINCGVNVRIPDIPNVVNTITIGLTGK